ncbi:MAG: beta-Ala-His dipeptidase [Gemmatimonadales bacterium]|nr:beta-Ala-His dipeptidase [Gemmatimonadales bacterium]NIN10628.1 beta-Ala-His dipeptidase [Gemmatimonadales bacterium]NIN49390.1 beta-Ala-His dipeptidase [Gemmatimonadales bacterium]NIP06854.1 beta-Ala-His dipeptidase [Gemmatimonadales bacterium]NIR01528.1 beta-Ala-His dipeptidase [Gemmatimonadales bacterium]
MTFVDTLEPKAVWQHFDQILMIPRGSKEEDKIRQHVISVAERAGLAQQTDEAGNLVVRKPGTKGHEKAPVTILQSHLDMVNEKNSDVEHDFSKDPIKPRRDGDYLTASGTTLGSDNGIGVASMLAIMEAKDLTHGPLELLFTIDEETGLVGASGLAGDMLQGRRLINLDSEEEGALYVGCAGGADSTLTLPLGSTPTPSGCTALRTRFHGLKGGHSGVDIHLQRGNAVKLLARALFAVSPRAPFHLAAIEGGNKHNAIPREAFATAVVGETEKDAFGAALNEEFSAIRQEFRPADPEMQLEVADAEMPGEVWDHASAETALRLLTGLPHGVLAMSYDIPDLVETSTNLATVRQRDNSLVIGMSSRSSVDTALAALRQRIRATATLAGAAVEEGSGYPGWKPNLDSHLLKVLKDVYARELGREPEIKAIHAGLECGIIGEKVPGTDMISMGPQIEFPHSPDERVKIDSVGEFYSLLTTTLEVLAAAS